MREAVSAEERLIATLRYLAVGNSYEDLKFTTAISPQLLGRIIPETCTAIYFILLILFYFIYYILLIIIEAYIICQLGI